MTALSHAKPIPAPSQTMLIPIAAIDVKPQVRTHFDKESLADLTESVKANGILQPLLLVGPVGDRYTLVAGERRLRAAKAAGLSHVPAIAGPGTPNDIIRMQIAENMDREDLDPEEIAKVVRQLYDDDCSLADIAAILRRSKSWVSKHLAITMRWEWRARKLLEEGVSDDIELLGAFSQYCISNGNSWEPGTRVELDRVEKLIRTGKIDRDGMRRLVAEAKAKAKAKKQAEDAKAKAKAATPAKAKPKRFNPKTVVRDLFSRAHGWIPMDGEPELSPPDDARTYVDANQVEKIREVLRGAYEAGVRAAGADGDPYKAVLAKFYSRSYMEGYEHAAWIAGAFGRPLDLATLLEDVMAASKREDLERDFDDDGEPDDEE